MATMEAAAPAEDLALDFDGWAELSARLLQLDPEARADVLDERDLPVEEWSRADEHWNKVLAGEIVAGEMGRATAYGLRCAAELARRKDRPKPGAPGSPAESGPAPLAGDPRFLSEQAQPWRAEAAAVPLTAAAQEAPPVLGSSTRKVARAPVEVSETSLDLKLPVGPLLPFSAANAPAQMAARAAPLHPKVVRAPESVTGTADDLQLPRGPALPFLAVTGGGMRRAAAPDAPVVPGDLSVEQYAELRAHLTIRGEDHMETLARFGIKTHAAKEALQARFAARFQQDPQCWLASSSSCGPSPRSSRSRRARNSGRASESNVSATCLLLRPSAKGRHTFVLRPSTQRAKRARPGRTAKTPLGERL
jgi:hypothetical protein